MAAQRGRIRPPSVALRRLGGCSEARTLAHRENSPGVQAFQARRGRPPVRPLRRPGISPAQRPRRATSNWTVIPRLSSASASRSPGRRRTQPAEPRSPPPGIHDGNPSCETALSPNLRHPPDSAINSLIAHVPQILAWHTASEASGQDHTRREHSSIMSAKPLEVRPFTTSPCRELQWPLQLGRSRLRRAAATRSGRVASALRPLLGSLSRPAVRGAGAGSRIGVRLR